MEKFLILAALCVGFIVLDTVKSFPTNVSSVNEGTSNPLWLTNYFLTGFGFFLVIISIIFGCVCCRNGKGFKQSEVKVTQEFRNSSGNLAVHRLDGFVNPTLNSELTIFPPLGANSNEICRFEPLPDIKYQAQNLRPAAFSSNEQEISSQDWFLDSQNNFPRNQLKYVQEYGRGWFGRVVEGEAQNIIADEKVTKVMVKILHEDATPTDHMYFLHEVKFYRDLKHPNILSLLGQCLETEPFLIILECYPNGDLKSFLSQNLASAQALVEQGVTLKMCSNITSGLQFMHEKKFIHTDLAARNCLVGPDLTIKIGDYGNSIEIFKTDYYCAGSVALPVRWCAPETLKCTDSTIETREVTPLANIWSLGVVFWEICEFGKLPYAELNDDQVIVHVLGEKNYYLEKPVMFCLHKDELYHLMKLCWKPTLQRPTASQICVILNNLISSGKANQNETQIDSKRISQDFEQRWQNLKPNSIPKKDNAMEVVENTSVDCNIISLKLKNAKVVDSSFVDSPLGVFLTNKSFDKESPRFCLKSEKEAVCKVKVKSLQDGHGDDSKNQILDSGGYGEAHDEPKDSVGKVEFDCTTEFQIMDPSQNCTGKEPEVDSWLKGMEINNEEDESFVRKISEAIRDLDATLAMEKTSSSEENSGKSTRQSSPEKDVKETNEVTVDFKLGQGTSSFMNFTPKTFELSSLQNTEQPQSLNFTDAYNEKSKEFGEDFNSINLIIPFVEGNKCKSDILDESLRENDSLLCGQSRNSSDTDDEIWRRRIERGEISEKVKEKSKSIANLMILTHIDSDDSDIDFDKPPDNWLHRSSCIRRSGSFAKSSLSSNNFGSENDLTFAVLEEDFKNSLKKLSNEHKEHGHFDSLGVILPLSANRVNVWENLFKSSESYEETTSLQADVNRTRKESKTDIEMPSSEIFPEEEFKQNTQKGNNFLGNAASEKIDDNNKLPKGRQGQNSASTSKEVEKNLQKGNNSGSLCENVSVKAYSKCDSKTCETISSYPLRNSSHLEKSYVESDTTVSNLSSECSVWTNKANESDCGALEDSVGEFENFAKDPLKRKVSLRNCQNNKEESIVPFSESSPMVFKDQSQEERILISTDSLDLKSRSHETVSETWKKEAGDSVNVKEKPSCQLFGRPLIPEIKITEEPEEYLNENEEVFVMEMPVPKPLKFVLKDIVVPDVSEKSQLKSEGIISEAGSCNDELFTGSAEVEFKKSDDQESATVIVGPCEDFTMDFFRGLKTTSEDLSVENEGAGRVVESFQNREENLDVWDKHLERSFTQELSLTNFDDISFRSFCLYSSEEQETKQDNLVNNLLTCKCSVGSVMDFIESERLHTEKLEEPIHINRLTNLSVIASEEEYEHFKLRTPDDERSSDSGFRDKGSLSESVEDACEGKYNLEDIEAELEEAFVKGAFANCEVDKEKDSGKNSKNCSNFDCEESKFYEDENKNEEDFSDIDGEIEFWHNKDESDYYPEISEFNPTCSQGWYLHPPEENLLTYDRNINEDIVNALRNELEENLPVQSRSSDEFNEFYKMGMEDTNKDFNVLYTSECFLPLSPILEEQDSSSDASKKNTKSALFEENNTNRIKKNMVKLIESAKAIDTNTFMQYLDYMVENEGKDLYGTEEVTGDIFAGDINRSREITSLALVPEARNDTCEEDNLKKSSGVGFPSDSGNIVADGKQDGEAISLEESTVSPSSVRFPEHKTREDILVVNIDTNEATLLEEGKLESHRVFDLTADEKEYPNEITENSENEGLIFTPEMLSPDRERSLSETSRSSNGTRTGDALSEITMSSPDLVPDCFSTSVQETTPQNEVFGIIKEPVQIGIAGADNSADKAHVLLYSETKLSESPPEFETKASEEERSVTSCDAFEYLQAKETELPKSSRTSHLESTFHANDIYEMSTSFMGDDIDDVEEDTLSNSEKFERKQAVKERSGCQTVHKDLIEDNDTVDWQDESTEEELSSSSEEFIWKDGNKESKIKASQASDFGTENKLYERVEGDPSAGEVAENESRSQKDIIMEGETIDTGAYENDEDDNESSTGSSASFTDFVPSAWNSQATPSRSVLKSPDNKADKRKKNVWFKKQKYHCVYEYPREPSDSDDPDDSLHGQSSYEKSNISEAPLKHFNYGASAMEFPNKHFSYGIPKVIDLSTYTDWDAVEGEDVDLSLTDTDSDNGSGKGDGKVAKKADYSFYNLSPFDYDFNTTDMSETESEFLVSSSSRPFQVVSSSNFSPGFDTENKTIRGDFVNPKDFVTPDSGIEDAANVIPSDKIDLTQENIYLKMKNFTCPNKGVMNILDDLNFCFTPDSKETAKEIDFESFGNNTECKNGFWNSDTLDPLPNNGLGMLKHAKHGLKLDLPRNHNAELGTIMNARKE